MHKKYRESVQWLKDSALVHFSEKVHESYIPLLANTYEDQFKLYINDTGLLCSMYGPETRKNILNNSIKGYAEGGIYENIISECLVKHGYKLYYYKPDEEHKIEFLLERNGEVIPLEVKAGNNPTVSLNNFIRDYSPSYSYKLINGNV